MKEYKINGYLTLKLEGVETKIYIKGEKFIIYKIPRHIKLYAC